MPSSVLQVDSSAFNECSKLTYNKYDTAWYLGNETNPYVVLAKPENNEIKNCEVHKDAVYIYDNSFATCHALEKIVIHDKIKSIGSAAFFNAGNLRAVYIDDIASWCNINFKDYSSNPLCFATRLYVKNVPVSEIIVPDGVKSIPSLAFSCNNLITVKIPPSVKSIDASFMGAKNLKNVVLNEGLELIGGKTFENCTSLETITIPSTVKTLGFGTFRGCTALKSINVPDSVETIGDGSFEKCYNLRSVVFGNGITDIALDMFSDCSSLDSVVLGDSVTSIKKSAFSGCSSLQTLVLPKSLQSVGAYAFDECASLEKIYYMGTAQEWSTVTVSEIFNNALIDLEVYLYSESQPATSGKYWHYADGVPTEWSVE